MQNSTATERVNAIWEEHKGDRDNNIERLLEMGMARSRDRDDDLQGKLAFLVSIADVTPKSQCAALEGPDSEKWQATIQKELDQFEWLKMFKIVNQPVPGVPVLLCPFILKIKTGADGKIIEHKV